MLRGDGIYSLLLLSVEREESQDMGSTEGGMVSVDHGVRKVNYKALEENRKPFEFLVELSFTNTVQKVQYTKDWLKNSIKFKALSELYYLVYER